MLRFPSALLTIVLATLNAIEYHSEALAYPLSLRYAGTVVLAAATATIDHETIRGVTATWTEIGGLGMSRHAVVDFFARRRRGGS